MDVEDDGDYAEGEPDLDDDIPEGMEGSYQHTDTDVEDESEYEEAEPETHDSHLISSVWGSGGGGGGAISGAGRTLPPARGPPSRRSGGRMPGREN